MALPQQRHDAHRWCGSLDKSNAPRTINRRVRDNLEVVPPGRAVDREDIADAPLFLASDDAAWFSGTTLALDGAASAAGDLLNREFPGWK